MRKLLYILIFLLVTLFISCNPNVYINEEPDMEVLKAEFAEIMKSIDKDKTKSTLKTSFENVKWGSIIEYFDKDGKGEVDAFTFLNWLQGNDIIPLNQKDDVTISDMQFTKMLKAGHTDQYGTFTMQTEFPSDTNIVFNNEQLFIKAGTVIEFSLSGPITPNLTGTENVLMQLDKYSISTPKGQGIHIACDEKEHVISLSYLCGNISGKLVLDALKGSNMFMVKDILGYLYVDDLSLPTDVGFVIIDGYTIYAKDKVEQMNTI